MKSYFKIVLLFIAFACESGDPDLPGNGGSMLQISHENIKLSNKESLFAISVTSKGAWKAEVGQGSDWLSVAPDGGQGDGSFSLLAKDNSMGSLREGKIIVFENSKSAGKELLVEQLGADPDILIAYSNKTIPYEGGVFLVSVTSNIDWEIIIDEENQWIKQHRDDSLKSFVLTECKFKLEPNYDKKRTGKIMFRSTGNYQITKTAVVTQEVAEAFLTIGQDEYVIPFRMANLVIPYNTDNSKANVYVSTDNNWLQWNKSASTSTEIVLMVEDNQNSDFPRVGSVKVSCGNQERTIGIFQYGKPNPRIGDDEGAPVLAFPGAEGGGRFTTGGRNGRIYRVTNLLDYRSGQSPIPGSLRQGVEMSGARTLIFDVSGNIELTRRIKISNPNISIIGQTAPGDGITLKNYQLEFGSGVNPLNAIVRFIRIRTGDQFGDHEDDAVSGRWFKQTIIDHVSASWCVDECISFYGVKDFTIQWSIGSESLNNSQHEKGAHGYGGIWSGDNASFHHMLLAHHSSRVPRIASLSPNGPGNNTDNHGFFDVRNNVYYNWSGSGFGAYGGDYATFNLVNSYYKAGPATGTGSRSWRVMSTDPSARIYAKGNFATRNAQTFTDNWTFGIWDQFYHTINASQTERLAMVVQEPFPFGKTTTHTAEEAYVRVAAYVGASLRRDAVDKRLINEMTTGTTTYKGSISSSPQPGIIDRVSDTGGYPVLKSLPALPDLDGDGIPDVWEDAYGLDKNNPADAGSFDLDGLKRYSNLEVYFHNLVQHIIHHRNENGIPIEQIKTN